WSHLARRLAHEQEGSPHIDAHDPLEILERRVEDRPAVAQNAGTGDGDINRPKPPAHRFERSYHGLFVAGIALEGHAPATDPFDAFGCLLRGAGSAVKHRYVS